jgi:hypothetical protein
VHIINIEKTFELSKHENIFVLVGGSRGCEYEFSRAGKTESGNPSRAKKNNFHIPAWTFLPVSFLLTLSSDMDDLHDFPQFCNVKAEK